MLLYKLTDKNCCTYNGTSWGVNVTHEGTSEGELCGPGWIHAYTDPRLAVLFNPIHAAFSKPRLWEAKGKVGKEDRGLKVGCKKLTTLKEIPLPEITNSQRVLFAILCALEVCLDGAFIKWANDWLSGVDRSAYAAANAANAAAYAAYAAADAANAVANAAANAAKAANAADAVADAVANAAAYAAAYAAKAANAADAGINFIEILEKAISYETRVEEVDMTEALSK